MVTSAIPKRKVLLKRMEGEGFHRKSKRGQTQDMNKGKIVRRPHQPIKEKKKKKKRFSNEVPKRRPGERPLGGQDARKQTEGVPGRFFSEIEHVRGGGAGSQGKKKGKTS